MSSSTPELCPEINDKEDQLSVAEQALIASSLLVLLASLIGSLSSV